MSANIDKSLGEIISSRKTSTRGRERRNRGGSTAPVGGVKKNTGKPVTRTTLRAAIIPNAAASKGESKVIVSNLVGPDTDAI